MRVASNEPTANGGWLHHIDGTARPSPALRPLSVALQLDDLADIARSYRLDATPQRLAALAQSLGVPDWALLAFRLGWSGRAWSFPMFDSSGKVVGIRLRTGNGRKFSQRGGREGVFVPAGFPHGGDLLFPEGPTDSAAALALGFDCVGRPSCTGGRRYCVALAHGRDCVVVADADEPGQRGAQQLAAAILPAARSVRIFTPPAKDLRQWVVDGATRADLLAGIAQTPTIKLALREVAR
jgi:hypothetical protein